MNKPERPWAPVSDRFPSTSGLLPLLSALHQADDEPEQADITGKYLVTSTPIPGYGRIVDIKRIEQHGTLYVVKGKV